jgi:hypothetical protein
VRERSFENCNTATLQQTATAKMKKCIEKQGGLEHGWRGCISVRMFLKKRHFPWPFKEFYLILHRFHL